jgi:hypothetical protein
LPIITPVNGIPTSNIRAAMLGINRPAYDSPEKYNPLLNESAFSSVLEFMVEMRECKDNNKCNAIQKSTRKKREERKASGGWLLPKGM